MLGGAVRTESSFFLVTLAALFLDESCSRKSHLDNCELSEIRRLWKPLQTLLNVPCGAVYNCPDSKAGRDKARCRAALPDGTRKEQHIHM